MRPAAERSAEREADHGTAASGAANVMLTLAYDGTDFAGWQVQNRQRTVQGVLEAALARMLDRPVRVRAAGRTDSGVHAIGQVANFTAPMTFAAERWAVAINSCLPPDVRVLAARPVAAGFDARRSALARGYRYQLLSGAVGLPHLRRYCYHVRPRLDLCKMNRAAGYLVGEHDFTVFSAARDRSRSKVRRVISAAFFRCPPYVVFRIVATSFLWEDGTQHRGHPGGGWRPWMRPPARYGACSRAGGAPRWARPRRRAACSWSACGILLIPIHDSRPALLAPAHARPVSGARVVFSMFRSMTPDQRYWRLLSLIEDFYSGGERTAEDPPPVRFPRPVAERGPAAAIEHQDSLEAVASEVAACRKCGTVPGAHPHGAGRGGRAAAGTGDRRRAGIRRGSQRPAVRSGRAGEYLDRWLAAIELRRSENCFITNVVKCRPPHNRDPASEESQACLPFLQRQMRLLEPRAILTVGRIAGQLLTGQTATMARLREETHLYRIAGLAHPVPLVATYHPSGVLRNQSLRGAVWADLRRLQNLLAGTDASSTGAAASAAVPPSGDR